MERFHIELVVSFLEKKYGDISIVDEFKKTMRAYPETPQLLVGTWVKTAANRSPTRLSAIKKVVVRKQKGFEGGLSDVNYAIALISDLKKNLVEGVYFINGVNPGADISEVWTKTIPLDKLSDIAMTQIINAWEQGVEVSAECNPIAFRMSRSGDNVDIYMCL